MSGPASNFDWGVDEDFLRAVAQERLAGDLTDTLQYALDARGWTRADLARATGVTPSAITQRMRGSTNLTVKTVAEMLDAMGYGLELGLVDRRGQRHSVHRIRDYEVESQSQRPLVASIAWTAPGTPERKQVARVWK
jgi:transcriptional regulator with XRE-family HTH domain